ncbi:hypothetical protein GJAV_G00185270 [Gymnothorax javanicus]|nr:hypothetical protein GJAV_G00185270 [Gymnothorax javanicus]
MSTSHPLKERKLNKQRPLLPPQPGQGNMDVNMKKRNDRRAKKAESANCVEDVRKTAFGVAAGAGEGTPSPTVPGQEDPSSRLEFAALSERTPVPTEEQKSLTNGDDTIKLLQEAGSLKQTPEVKNLDSTEKLLEPFVPVIMEPGGQDPLPSSPVQKTSRLLPPVSTSEPSLSRQRRQRNRGNVPENHSDQASVTKVRSRPLPPPPRDVSPVSREKKSQGEQPSTAQVTAASSQVSSCGSGGGAITAVQKQPLSARERRRLRQSHEQLCYAVLPVLRRASCDTTAASRESDSRTAAVSCSVPDVTDKTTLDGRSSWRQSEDDDCSSSTSSTDRSEGDGKERKSETSEMQDLVQLMTQTLQMDSRDAVCEPDGPGSAAQSEFRFNWRYRDTLVLHGKATEFPSDAPSGPAKIRRAIEYLRTDAVKGLGVKLLNRVLDIMEEDDEEAREVRLREQMGEDKYQDYAVMVRQLKFFEDVAFRDMSVH